MEKTSYADSYRNIDFRLHPDKYKIGRGEQEADWKDSYKAQSA